MSVKLQPAQTEGSAGDVPDMVTRPVNGTETWLKGTIVLLSSGNVTEVGADVTTGLYGVTLEGAENGTPDGPADEVVVARINEQTEFIAQVWDGSAGSVRTDLSGLTIGDQFGYTVQSDVYMVDDSDTTNVVFEIEEILDDHDLVLVSFIPSTIA